MTDPVERTTARWRDGGGRFGMTPEWVLTHPAIDAQSARVYGFLALVASWDSGKTVVGIAEISEALGVSKRTIQRALSGLEGIGAIEVEKTHHPEHGQGWNRYLLVWSPPHDTGVTGGTTPESPPSHTYVETQIPRRDLYWDHLEGLFGYRATDSEAALWGKIISKIEASGDDPVEIPRRALIWAYHYDTPLTPSTLLHKWDWLGGKTAAVTEAERLKLRAMLKERAGESAYWASVEGKKKRLPGGKE